LKPPFRAFFIAAIIKNQHRRIKRSTMSTSSMDLHLNSDDVDSPKVEQNENNSNQSKKQKDPPSSSVPDDDNTESSSIAQANAAEQVVATTTTAAKTAAATLPARPIKRARTAYFIFTDEKRQEIQAQVSLEISSLVL
jgi:hypothetical protein